VVPAKNSLPLPLTAYVIYAATASVKVPKICSGRLLIDGTLLN
jgi:hypothetical protein